jgi:modulator of FtsH protease HflK
MLPATETTNPRGVCMDHDQYPFPDMPTSADLQRLWRRLKPLLTLIVAILAIIVIGVASYYQIEPDEVGVVKRFGKFLEISEPGPHFKIPFVDAIVKVPAKQQLKAEFGFRTVNSGINSSFTRDAETQAESMMLTGDLNVAVVEWIVHYQISDPYAALFKVRNSVVENEVVFEDVLRDLTEAAMREVVGDYSIDEVLTSGREEILQLARVRLSELCARYETGLTIQRIELRVSAPPDPVKPSFNEVNQAEQERDRLSNEAWAQYNKEIPRARGEARQILQEAEGYAVERVNQAKGDATRFLALQKQYAKSPEVTRTRLYLETMNKILPQAGKKLYTDAGSKGGVYPLLYPIGQGMTPATPVAAGEGGAR